MELERRTSVLVFTDSPDSLLASLASGNEPGRLILVTGPSGSGKTRWCLALAEHAASLGIHVGGLVSPAVFEDDRKVGIALRDLWSGAQRRLAIRKEASKSGQITEEWRFNDDTLNWGNNILAQPGSCQLFILDELGPLEFACGIGLINGLELITSRRYPLACVVVRSSLLPNARECWPWAQVYALPAKQEAG
jgi:nucleoside-triphosphatase THEP1